MDINNHDLINVGLSSNFLVDVWHDHNVAQLSYAAAGILYAQIADKLYIVPPNMAIYIPPKTLHRTNSKKVPQLENIYFSKEYFDLLPTSVQLIHISELVKQVINKVCSLGLASQQSDFSKSLFMVLAHEINASSQADYSITIPNDPRLLKVYDTFLSSKEMFPSLEEAAASACVGVRTLTRLFIKDTGLNFVTWKQHFIFIRALELLQRYKQTKVVAYRLGYNSESAFISMFKKMSGAKVPSYFVSN